MNTLKTKLIFGLILLLTAASCGEKSSQNDESEAQVEKRKIGSDSSSIAIAYYVQDSIAKGFNFYREIDSMLKEKERAFQKELESRYRSYQQYEQDIQKRMNAGEITGFQYDDIQKTIAQKQQNIAQFEQQRGTELQKESAEYTTALMNKIAEAGKEFSEKKGIDILFFYQKGGQITYISDAFDVTEDFVAYLNKREDELKSEVEEEVEDSKKKDKEEKK
ncbi:MAG: OmpH family outer membrane protein [Brumimicrobium sp.]|nr:OmpH family outer membrane protein [Brumimicrobium sp.]